MELVRMFDFSRAVDGWMMTISFVAVWGTLSGCWMWQGNGMRLTVWICAPFLMVWVVDTEPVFRFQLFPVSRTDKLLRSFSHPQKPSRQVALQPSTNATVYLSAPVACS